MSYMNNSNSCCNDNSYTKPIPQVASMPYELYVSLQGKYFVGYGDDLTFEPGKGAWAALVNPCHSGVNLHVNVWTVTSVGTVPLRAQIWFNSTPPGAPTSSPLVTPSNTAIYPLPKPKVRLLEASNVSGTPEDGTKAFVRRVLPEVTIADNENGKFIFPPGGSFLIFISAPEAPTLPGSGRIAFGWWEEPVC